ncbi:DNA mismatch repair protein msh6 [Dispira simplex]|nr:DNA mismatch repair protein msh6 [Dispira simplex]
MAPECTSPSLSEAQRQRIEENRKRALQRLQDKTKIKSNGTPTHQRNLLSFFTPGSSSKRKNTSSSSTVPSDSTKRYRAEPVSPRPNHVRHRTRSAIADNSDSDYSPEEPSSSTPAKRSTAPLPTSTMVTTVCPTTPRRNLSRFMSSSANKSPAPAKLAPSTPTPADKATDRYLWLVDIRDANQRPPTHPDYDPRTLFIPPAAWKKFTPFEQQFWEIKARHFDTVVFFKKGKFYELYEKDADIGHQHFDLKLTDRVNMRMVGVPESSFEFWASQFIAKGYKIAKVDQMETAIGKSMREKAVQTTKADKIIRRELTQILTAGTLVDGTMLQQDAATYCLCFKEFLRGDHQPPKFGVCFVDTATGHFHVCGFQDDLQRTTLETLLVQVQPKEVVYERGHVSRTTWRLLNNLLHAPVWNGLVSESEFWDHVTTVDQLQASGYFADSSLQGWPAILQNLDSTDPLALSAVGGLVSYLRSLKLDHDLVSLGNFSQYQPMCHATSLLMDGQTMANLELFQTTDENQGGEAGTLFQLINRCVTPFGKRLLRRWLCHPLRDPDQINQRLDVVDLLCHQPLQRDRLRGGLQGLPDLERLISRVHAGTCRIKDLLGVLRGFTTIQTLLNDLGSQFPTTSRLYRLVHQCPDLTQLLEFFRTAFDHDIAEQRGYIVPSPGVEAAYDRVLGQQENLEQRFAQYLEQQRQVLKCSTVEYRDLGKEIYQLEVPKAVKVPHHYVQLSATKACSRYWTAELQTMVKEFNELQETRNSVVLDIERRMYQRFDEHYRTWLSAVMVVAELDCLLSLAYSAQSFGEPVCRPEFVVNPQGGRAVLDIGELRHPCVAAAPGLGSSFIPNDTLLGGDSPNLILLTGPNAGGKSTLLRQTCLAVILAQLGCYVPARHCRLSPVDRIFTRIGAHDDILRGQSTFMVELSETSKILQEATSHSLVILDELGRGTSTFDGYAVALAVLHHLATRTGCLGLFSTHYHALTQELREHPEIALRHMDCRVDNEQGDVTFLYKLVEGVCPKSYGMNVASMVGVPKSIVERAEQVADAFEAVQKLRTCSLADSPKSSTPVPHYVHTSTVPMACLAEFKYLWQTGETLLNNHPAIASPASPDEPRVDTIMRIAKHWRNVLHKA